MARKILGDFKMRNQKVTRRPHSSSRAKPRLAASNVREEVHKQEFLAALREVDFSRCDPRPTTDSYWISTGRTMYLNFVSSLKNGVEQADLNDPREFHSFFWMLIRLGANPRFIAKAHHVSPAVISRWQTGKQTPEVLRRRPILQSALASLDENLRTRSLVPLQEYSGIRAPRLPTNPTVVVATG